MDTQLLRRALDLLETVTPLETNCGLLCSGACCRPDEDGQGGVLLFPGERALLESESWLRVVPAPVKVNGVDYGMMLCDGTCERAMRPLGCRIFPLTPVLRGDRWNVRLDRRAWAMCPLMEHGIRGLSAEFVRTVCKAVNLIGSDPEGREFLLAWERAEAEYGRPLF